MLNSESPPPRIHLPCVYIAQPRGGGVQKTALAWHKEQSHTTVMSHQAIISQVKNLMSDQGRTLDVNF